MTYIPTAMRMAKPGHTRMGEGFRTLGGGITNARGTKGRGFSEPYACRL